MVSEISVNTSSDDGLMAPSHYLNEWWLWHSFERDIYLYNQYIHCNIQITFGSSAYEISTVCQAIAWINPDVGSLTLRYIKCIWKCVLLIAAFCLGFIVLIGVCSTFQMHRWSHWCILWVLHQTCSSRRDWLVIFICLFYLLDFINKIAVWQNINIQFNRQFDIVSSLVARFMGACWSCWYWVWTSHHAILIRK